MTQGWVQISDEAAAYLLGVLAEHQPGRHGWCRCCGQRECAAGRDAAVELAIAGRLELTPAWAVRPDLGSWP